MKNKIIALSIVGLLLLTGLTAMSAVGKEARNKDDGLKPSAFVTCFAMGTKITMEDGAKKNIEDLKPGDELLSYDVEKGEFTSWRVKNIEQPNRPVYSINDGLLYITEDHPLRIKKPEGEIGWGSIIPMPTHVRLRREEILKIEIGDFLFTEEDKWIEVTDITYDETVIKCYNIFSSTGTKTYFANGILAYEEYPYFFPYMMKYWAYQICSKIPALERFKDRFLF